MSDFLFTSESVSEGHPDKVADQISDAVLDAILAQDPHGRVAAETLVSTGLVVMTGEITTGHKHDYARIARDTNYVGGLLPKEVSTHYPGATSGIRVTITRPAHIGFTIHPGDQIQSQGSSYGSNQIVENFYSFTSTADAPSIQSHKSVASAVGIYPQLLVIPQ